MEKVRKKGLSDMKEEGDRKWQRCEKKEKMTKNG